MPLSEASKVGERGTAVTPAKLRRQYVMEDAFPIIAQDR